VTVIIDSNRKANDNSNIRSGERRDTPSQKKHRTTPSKKEREGKKKKHAFLHFQAPFPKADSTDGGHTTDVIKCYRISMATPEQSTGEGNKMKHHPKKIQKVKFPLVLLQGIRW